ncbi:MAG: hypothetical protein LHW57_00100 [Candidatus Cloacimonetes bacterium]|nr:hypothetical protein [Candidatus Cloacimonadota bacterium]
MFRSILAILLLTLLWSCASVKELPQEEEYETLAEEEYVPEEIDPTDGNRFYIAVFNEEDEVVEEFLARGFEIGKFQEDLAEKLYFEIYHSVEGFESRYLEGPLDTDTQAYYDELEQQLIGLCQRLKDLGLEPNNPEDLISAATFREFPALVKWLATEFGG